MRISEFIKPPEIEITIVTHRSIFQAEHAHEKLGDAYASFSAEILMDAADMRQIGVKDGENVEIRNEHGFIVVRAKKDEERHEGIAFMCNSIFANLLASPAPPQALQLQPQAQHALPSLKRIKAKISATKENITNIKDITKRKL